MVSCETDFVGKTDDFRQFGKDVLELGIKFKPKTVEELSALQLQKMTVAEKINEILEKPVKRSR